MYFPYYKLGQCSTGILCDLTGGKFGPFQEQLFVGDLTHSMVMRVFLEKVNGRYQGVAFPFRRGFDSGNVALEYAPDGSMFVFGSNRGWGCVGPKPFALQRLVWTGKIPFEVARNACQVGRLRVAFYAAGRSANSLCPGVIQPGNLHLHLPRGLRQPGGGSNGSYRSKRHRFTGPSERAAPHRRVGGRSRPRDSSARGCARRGASPSCTTWRTTLSTRCRHRRRK